MTLLEPQPDANELLGELPADKSIVEPFAAHGIADGLFNLAIATNATPKVARATKEAGITHGIVKPGIFEEGYVPDAQTKKLMKQMEMEDFIKPNKTPSGLPALNDDIVPSVPSLGERNAYNLVNPSSSYAADLSTSKWDQSIREQIELDGIDSTYSARKAHQFFDYRSTVHNQLVRHYLNDDNPPNPQSANFVAELVLPMLELHEIHSHFESVEYSTHEILNATASATLQMMNTLEIDAELVDSQLAMITATAHVIEAFDPNGIIQLHGYDDASLNDRIHAVVSTTLGASGLDEWSLDLGAASTFGPTPKEIHLYGPGKNPRVKVYFESNDFETFVELYEHQPQPVMKESIYNLVSVYEKVSAKDPLEAIQVARTDNAPEIIMSVAYGRNQLFDADTAGALSGDIYELVSSFLEELASRGHEELVDTLYDSVVSDFDPANPQSLAGIDHEQELISVVGSLFSTFYEEQTLDEPYFNSSIVDQLKTKTYLEIPANHTVGKIAQPTGAFGDAVALVWGTHEAGKGHYLEVVDPDSDYAPVSDPRYKVIGPPGYSAITKRSIIKTKDASEFISDTPVADTTVQIDPTYGTELGELIQNSGFVTLIYTDSQSPNTSRIGKILGDMEALVMDFKIVEGKVDSSDASIFLINTADSYTMDEVLAEVAPLTDINLASIYQLGDSTLEVDGLDKQKTQTLFAVDDEGSLAIKHYYGGLDTDAPGDYWPGTSYGTPAVTGQELAIASDINGNLARGEAELGGELFYYPANKAMSLAVYTDADILVADTFGDVLSTLVYGTLWVPHNQAELLDAAQQIHEYIYVDERFDPPVDIGATHLPVGVYNHDGEIVIYDMASGSFDIDTDNALALAGAKQLIPDAVIVESSQIREDISATLQSQYNISHISMINPHAFKGEHHL